MELRCPGRMAHVVDSTSVPCPQCGRNVELFGDEFRVRCRCRTWVFRETLPSCAQWCSAAARCFGTVGRPAVAAGSVSDPADQEQYERRLAELKAHIADALASCTQPESQQQPNAETDAS